MWRTLTFDDIAATLSSRELEAFRQSSPIGGDDPVDALLSRTAGLVRSYIRANGHVGLSRVPASLPESLISPACDYAAFDILKRMPVPISEDRRRAREQAIALFEKIARREVTPEPDHPDDGAGQAAAPLAGTAKPPRLLD